jgi:hypothetical protein
MTDRFEGVTLTKTTITHGRDHGPAKGATATVDASANAGSRITATRLVTIGVFALAAKKKTGCLYLSVNGDGYAFTVEVPIRKEAEARKFAAKINAR